MGSVGTRWLGVGLAALLAVVTLGLALTGRLGLYINPESSWFAVGMAVLVLVGAALSFALPLGAEADHSHSHGDEPAHDHSDEPAHGAASARRRMGSSSEDSGRILRHAHDSPNFGSPQAHRRTHPAALAATVVGGVAASGVVLLTLVLPPASLSAELAMSRDVGAPPLFAGSDAVTLAATGDTASFGVGEWAMVFATATNPDAFEGDAVTLTGFVTPRGQGAGGDGDGFDLTRLVITHCVIDAQSASLAVAASDSAVGGSLDTGQWVTVTGTVNSTADGRLEIDATSVEPIDEPEDPYEY